jgi:predicted small secreted protein
MKRRSIILLVAVALALLASANYAATMEGL